MRSNISTLDGRAFDVVVVGGGINGAAAAQYLRADGFNVLLIDKNDFGSGATSRSSRLLHCGLRYMAPRASTWEYVRNPNLFVQKLRKARTVFGEYQQLRKESPQRLRPIKLVVPLYDTEPVFGWQVDLGAWLMGARSSASPINYRRYSGANIQAAPLANVLGNPEKLKSIITFEDCQFIWPERLCVDSALDAERMGATVRNYVKATAWSKLPDGNWEITLDDMLTPGNTARVKTNAVVNTAGPWVDDVNKAAAKAVNVTPRRKVTGTKGAHILVQLPPEFQAGVLVANNRDGETIACMPWYGLHYFGPTETVYEGDLDDVRPLEEDIAYLIDEANFLFPGLKLKRQDVRFAWAGIRAVTYAADLPKGNRVATAAVFDQSDEGLENVFSLTWGPVNQHRVAAKRLLAAISRRIRPSLSKTTLSHEVRGTTTASSRPVHRQQPDVTVEDLLYAARNEHPQTLADLLFRRVNLGWGGFLRLDDVRRIAAEVSPLMEWDVARQEKEVSDFAGYLKRYHLYDLT